MSPATPYHLTVDLNVLKHLGEGLYSSVAAVLTETIANAWDADATLVEIDLDIANDVISIRDDGIGMSVDSVNERYLKVGYQRRKNEGDRTRIFDRLSMGRKGIGKLSLISIANIISITTREGDDAPHGLEINAEALLKAMDNGNPDYFPPPIPEGELANLVGSGTSIKLSSLKENRFREIEPASLRRRIARRFSIIGSENFQVTVNGTPVTSQDREDLKFAEYLWVFEGTQVDLLACVNLKKKFELSARNQTWPNGWSLRGWIATTDKPKRLATNEGNLNSIIALARGRLVDENLLDRISTAQFYMQYLTGQIEVDFLDDSSDADIVTSNRQKVVEDDPRFVQVLNFLGESLKELAASWSGLRVEDKTNELRRDFPKIGP